MSEIDESEDEFLGLSDGEKENIFLAKLADCTKEKFHVLKNKDIDFFNLNQGIFKGQWYFGKLFDDEGMLQPGIVLSSKYVAIGHTNLMGIGLKGYGDLEIQKSTWSNDDIKKWLTTPAITDKLEIFNQIRNKILFYMDFPDERIADVCTCWVIGTYCYELFESYGYLYFNALRNSGKTKIKNILKFMGFNGTEASNISESGFFRTIENRKGLLCLDEYEKLDDIRKRILDQLLNAGHEKSASVIRTERIGDKFIAREFSVFCPKIICNITGMNPTTQSRCITIKLMRTNRDQGRRQVRFQDPDWQNIRNKCFRLIMENWKGIKEIYENYDGSNLINRNEDIWKSLLSIAKFFSEEIEKGLIEYSGTNIEESSIDMLEGNWHYELLKTMYNQTKEHGDGWYQTSQIGTWILGTLIHPNSKSQSPARWVGRQLAILPKFKRRKMSSGNEWYLSTAIIKEVMDRLTYPIPQDYSTNSSNSINPTDSSNSTHNDIQS
jgi:hypothetical protein